MPFSGLIPLIPEKNLFSEKDLKRFQSHEKGLYPSEENYESKEKITSYKKKIYNIMIYMWGAPAGAHAAGLNITGGCDLCCWCVYTRVRYTMVSYRIAPNRDNRGK